MDTITATPVMTDAEITEAMQVVIEILEIDAPAAACTGCVADGYADRECPFHGEQNTVRCGDCKAVAQVVDRSWEQVGYEERAHDVYVLHLSCGHSASM